MKDITDWVTDELPYLIEAEKVRQLDALDMPGIDEGAVRRLGALAKMPPPDRVVAKLVWMGVWRGYTVEDAAFAVGEAIGLDERRVRDRWYTLSKPMRRAAIEGGRHRRKFAKRTNF